ncbi:MAG: hypothetical protein IEMM0006_1595 [bacterium]|nr:MAG: hypothetical protein IEMM0006_1595 [bacterium]
MVKETFSNSGEIVLETLREYIPPLFEAANFAEKQDRILPMQVFYQMKDILSHIRDIAKEPNDPEVLNKNLIEIKEHFRRGIIETYQEHFDYQMSHLFQTYGNYRKRLLKFEMLLGLFKKNKVIHLRIKKIISEAEQLWINARNIKTNDVGSENFNNSIKMLKKASEITETIEEDINLIFNNFYKRATYFTFITVAFISIIILLFL